MRPNSIALDHFVDQLEKGFIQYKNGELWRHWEPRRGWLEKPKRAEKLTTNGYFLLRTVLKDKGSLYVMAHRVIWAAFNGEIPPGMEINHINGIKTDNRIENLELVSQKENKQHAKETGLYRPAKGLNSGRGKLSEEDVRKIRDLLDSGNYLQREIAEMFGVRPNQISRIKTGARRKMDFNDFQIQSTRTIPTDRPKEQIAANFALGLVSECGEVGDQIKKHVFHGHDLDKEELKKELGDVLFYLSGLAYIHGIDLNEVAEKNIEKLRKRYPNGFSVQDSINRVE